MSYEKKRREVNTKSRVDDDDERWMSTITGGELSSEFKEKTAR